MRYWNGSDWLHGESTARSAKPTDSSVHGRLAAAPGWYPDPDARGERYWDGTQWTAESKLSRRPSRLFTTMIAIAGVLAALVILGIVLAVSHSETGTPVSEARICQDVGALGTYFSDVSNQRSLTVGGEQTVGHDVSVLQSDVHHAAAAVQNAYTPFVERAEVASIPVVNSAAPWESLVVDVNELISLCTSDGFQQQAGG